MMLREGRRGFAQTVRVPSYGGRRFGQIVIFIVAKKLNLLFILLYFRHLWRRGLVENVIWGEGLAENVRIPSCGE